jgi:hypothetical protein
MKYVLDGSLGIIPSMAEAMEIANNILDSHPASVVVKMRKAVKQPMRQQAAKVVKLTRENVPNGQHKRPIVKAKSIKVKGE